MADFDICLSSAAMKNIALNRIQEDFEFVVGGQRYNCPRIIAEFLSPRICLSHSVDSSIAEYFVETSALNDQLQLFISLGLGSTIRVTKANLGSFLSLSREFSNSDLYSSLIKHSTNKFVRSKLHDSATLDLFSDRLIGRISSEFYRRSMAQLDEIPVSVLFHVLSHNLLKISSEDDLFWYVNSRICLDPEYFDLFRFVRFEYLSAECVSDFLLSLPDSIDHRLWESIAQRLVSRVGVEFLLKKAKSLRGIIAHLTGNSGRNLVKITSKSVCFQDHQHHLRNGADLTSDSIFQSKDEPGQWVCWDFGELRVRPTHYTIKASSMQSWVLESSLDREAWTEIDRKTNNLDFKMASYRDTPKTASYAVSESLECRFIRLTQTGMNDRGTDFLTIAAFDVFGTLITQRE